MTTWTGTAGSAGAVGAVVMPSASSILTRIRGLAATRTVWSSWSRNRALRSKTKSDTGTRLSGLMGQFQSVRSVRPTTGARAKQHVVDQRIHAGGGHAGVPAEVVSAIELRVWVGTLTRIRLQE